MSDTEQEENDDIELAPERLRTTRGAADLPRDLRGYGSTPSKLPSNSAEREDWWVDQITQSQAFLVALDEPTLKHQLQNPVVGHYVSLPIPAYVGLTHRFSDVKENTLLPVIQRHIFTDLQTFVQGKEGLTYVHGPQGFGKSFALYHLFCALSTYPNNRVLYIPNCATINEDSIFKLFKAIGAAFARDPTFVDLIYPLALSFTNHSWELLLGRINKHCETNNLTFFAIFDQHNGLKQEQRQCAPTNLLQWPEALNGSFFKLIISAYANNSDQTVTKDIKSLFPFFEGLSQNELAAWRVKNAFFVNEPSLDNLTELTRNIPYELFRVLESLKDFKPSVPHPTLRQVLAAYRDSRLVDLNKAHDKYLKDNGAALPDLNYGLTEHKCMLYMANDLALPTADKLVFDRQLFFLTPPSGGFHHIRPTFPLALDMVLNRLQPLDSEVFTKEVFESALPNDAKGRMAEYYIIQCLTKHRHLTLPLYPVRGDIRDDRLDVDLVVERFHDIIPPHLPTHLTLFVPSSAKYNDVDFLLFDPHTSRLYCFQVTVQAEPWEHANTWIAGDGTSKGRTIYDEWMKFCSPNMTTKVWFVVTSLGKAIQPKTKGAKPKKFLAECTTHKWVTFGDPEVKQHFPALKYFKS